MDEQYKRRAKVLGRTSFTAAQIDAHAAHLTKEHLAVLRASLTDDYEKIAAALTLPVGTVKSRLNRARIALQKRIKLAEATAGPADQQIAAGAATHG